jgi:REP element-mobilizing transposase RayT
MSQSYSNFYAHIVFHTKNNVHILCTLPKTMSIADLTEEVKKSSSKWIKTKGVHYQNFYWQDGYGGFSVGWSQIEMVKRSMDRAAPSPRLLCPYGARNGSQSDPCDPSAARKRP